MKKIILSFIAILLIMTIKQIFGLILISSAIAYHIYDNNNRSINTPTIVPEHIPQKEKITELFFTDVDRHRDMKEKTIYGDVLSHSFQEPYGDKNGRRINVHETSHGITSELRKFYETALKKKLNVFYVLDGKCIVLEESNIDMRLVTKYIPLNLRSYRYNLYFVKGIVDWNDMPSYIIDEWNAYILASMSAVEDYNNKILDEKVDAVSGCLDFSIYAVSFALAVYENDKEYWDSYPQFKNTIKFLLIRAEKTFLEGISIDNFRTQSQLELHEKLLNHPDSSDVRNFLKKEFDGIFLNPVL